MGERLAPEHSARHAAQTAGRHTDGGPPTVGPTVADLEARIARLEHANRELAAREARLSAIIEAETQCVKQLARDGTVLDMNPAGLAMIDADTLEQVAGRSIYPLIAGDDQNAVRMLVESAFAGNPGVVEFRCTGLKGIVRHLEMHASPLRDPGGAVIAALGITRDITRRRTAQSLQLQAESTLQALIDAVPSFIAVVDAEGRYEIVNGRYEQWFERPRSQIVGQRLTDVHRPSTYATMLPNIRRVLAGHPVRYDSDITGRDGKGYSFDVRYIPRRLSSGEINGYFVLALDVTESKQAEAAKREADERLRLAIAASNIGLWDWDVRTNKVNYSREWKSQLGYRDDEIGDDLGEWERLVHPDDVGPALQKAQRYMLEREGAFETEFRMLHKDGSWRWIYSRGEVFADASGGVERFLGWHIDFTDRKLAEEKCAASEARFRTLVEGAGVIVWEFDPSVRTFTYVSPQAALLGYPIQDWYTVDFWAKHIHPDDREWAVAYGRVECEARRNHRFQYRMLAADGRTVWIEDLVVIEPSAKGDGSWLERGVLVDITERKRAAAAVAAAERRESMAAVAGGIAHEFNSTLLAAATMLQSVDEVKCEGAARGPVARAVEMIQQAQSLSASLLELYAGPERPERPRLELRAWLDERIDHLERILPEGMAVSLHIEPRWTTIDGRCTERELWVCADPLALEQVLRILLGNACDALNGFGKVRISVAAGAAPDPARVTISVSDDGPGVPPELRERLFDPFFSTRSRPTRSGMGLAIAARLVEQVGGELSYRPSETGGSCFVISLVTPGRDAQ